MKKILVLAVIAFVLAFGMNRTVVKSSDSPIPTPKSDLSYQYCINYVYTDTTISECSGTPGRPNDSCREVFSFVNGKIRYVMTCDVIMTGPFNSPLPVPLMPTPVAPDAIPPLHAQVVPEGPAQVEPVQPAHCFAFGFPCTDYNPGAQEGCICFCDMPMWCPN